DGAHLRIGNDAAAKRVRNLRQMLERPRHPHPLARCDLADAALPVEPLRTVDETMQRPAFEPVVFGHQLQEAVLRCVDVPPKLRDLGFQTFQRRNIGSRRAAGSRVTRSIEGGRSDGHGASPETCFFIQYSGEELPKDQEVIFACIPKIPRRPEWPSRLPRRPPKGY